MISGDLIRLKNLVDDCLRLAKVIQRDAERLPAEEFAHLEEYLQTSAPQFKDILKRPDGPNLKIVNRQGFSLIELLMVAALLMIILGLTLPNLLRARFKANETSAVGAMKVIYGAENRYAAVYNSFSPDLTSLGPPTAGAPPDNTAADYVDTVLAGRVAGNPLRFVKSGYQFTYTSVGAYPAVRQFFLAADPVARGSTGERSFWMDQTGVIHYNSSAAATINDTPLI